MDQILAHLQARVRAFIGSSLSMDPQDHEFSALALALFAAQLQSNPAFRRLCAARGVGPVHDWRAIPAVPTVAFKELDMTSLAPAERARTFLSSGTTGQRPSRHHHSLLTLGLYEESLWRWFDRQFQSFPQGQSWLFLTPPSQDAPHSSLAHMFHTIAARQPIPRVSFVGGLDSLGAWRLDFDLALAALRSAQSLQRPIALLGTAFLFVELLDALQGADAPLTLPQGSWIIETGGYKGRTREIPKEEFHRQITAALGIPRTSIFGEYGMGELSSQAYDRADGVFHFPPWARVQVISPATGQEAPDGEPGLIRVTDLANIGSVIKVQTEDFGVAAAGGFRLLGRAPASEARGCSLLSA